MTPITNTIACVECGEESEGKAIGWRAYVNDEGEVLIYCPCCEAGELEDA